MQVKNLMTKNPVCVESEDFITKARSLMRDHGFRALPVLENGRLVGIVSRGDVLRVTSRKTNVLVKGLMSENVVTTNPDDDIFEVVRKMVESGVRQLPVTDNGKLIGIITSKDILSEFVRKEYEPVKKRVRDVMTTDVVYCEQEDEISRIWDKMYSSGYSGFPVVKKGRVIGMITRGDIIRDGSIMLSRESGKVRNTRVKKVQKTPAITTTADSSVKSVAKMMIEKNITRLPVVDEWGKLIGIVDIDDMLRAYMG